MGARESPPRAHVNFNASSTLPQVQPRENTATALIAPLPVLSSQVPPAGSMHYFEGVQVLQLRVYSRIWIHIGMIVGGTFYCLQASLRERNFSVG